MLLLSIIHPSNIILPWFVFPLIPTVIESTLDGIRSSFLCLIKTTRHDGTSAVSHNGVDIFLAIGVGGDGAKSGRHAGRAELVDLTNQSDVGVKGPAFAQAHVVTTFT